MCLCAPDAKHGTLHTVGSVMHAGRRMSNLWVYSTFDTAWKLQPCPTSCFPPITPWHHSSGLFSKVEVSQFLSKPLQSTQISVLELSLLFDFPMSSQRHLGRKEIQMRSWWFGYASWDLEKSSGVREAQEAFAKLPGLPLIVLLVWSWLGCRAFPGPLLQLWVWGLQP